MKLPLVLSFGLLLPFTLPPANAADIVKANNATALNVGTAWTGGVVPGTGGVAVWNNTFTAVASGSLSTLGGDLSFQGLKVTNPGGTANTNNLVGFTNASSANTLTLGSAGIDMSTATQVLLIQSKLALGANQTWNIANANTSQGPATLNVGEDLAINAVGTGATFNLGGFTLTKTGAGVAAISSGYTVSNGTINVNGGILHLQSGSSRVTTLASDVIVNVNNGGTLALAAQSAAVNANGSITLNTGSTLNLIPAQPNAINITGGVNVAGNTTINVTPQLSGAQIAGSTLLLSGNLTGSGNINYLNTLTTAVNRLRLSGDNSGYTGTLTMASTTGSSRFLRLQSATAGSAAATWALTAGNTLEVDGTGVQLGTLNGAGTVTNSHATNAATITVGAGNFSGAITNGTPTTALVKTTAGTLTLSGANTYTGGTQVNAGTLLTTPAQTGSTSITVADGATFGVVVPTAGTTFSTTSLALGTTTGSTLVLATGLLGNPTAAPVSATTFTPSAGTLIQLTSTELTPATGIPLISYGTLGGAGFAGLSLNLPARTLGNLVDNAASSRVDLDISSVEQVKWSGAVDGVWDIDPTGAGSAGTPNWTTTVTNASTRFLQGSGGTDTANFDDSAPGTHNVSLATTLTPLNVKVSGTGNYTFGGPGKLSGGMILSKTGTGNLTIANATPYDYTGGTTIAAGGRITLGDGATAGAGSLPGTIANDGTFSLNRPDDFSLPNTFTGNGTLLKQQANTVTVPNAFTNNQSVQISAGKLLFAAGGTITAPVSGTGQLQAGGGTLQLGGTTANTNSGLTTVSAGLLQLNKTAGVNAVGGNIEISGTGQLSLLAAEQIPDSANINFTGSSVDSIPVQTGQETIGNINVNSSVGGLAGGQVVMRNNFTVSGTATVNSGIFGVASSQTGTANAINITSAAGSNAIIRIAGSGGASVLNVGSGGITASGGEIQVKFNTNAQDATLNLGGDFTATGNVLFTNAGYTGANLNVINLTANRTFNIDSGTTTTVAPDFGGPGGLTKSGGGTLALLTTSTGGWAGATVIQDGTLSLAGSATLPTSNTITVNAPATLDVSALSTAFTLSATQTLGGKGTINGTVATTAGSKIAPGESPGTLTFNGNFILTNAITPTGSAALQFELATPGTSDQIALGAAAALSIGSGVFDFDDFAFSALAGFGPGTYVLFDTQAPINGTLGANLTGTIGGYESALSLADGTNDIVLTVVPEPSLTLLAASPLLLTLRRRRRMA